MTLPLIFIGYDALRFSACPGSALFVQLKLYEIC